MCIGIQALSDGENARKSVRLLRKKWISYLNKLTFVTRSKLNKVERNKVVSLITVRLGAAFMFGICIPVLDDLFCFI